ncbi:MAG: NAD(P)/FAD-dependent oxidoreductase [bacterium]
MSQNPSSAQVIDVLIIGASASGLMCAREAARRGRKVVVLDHANKVGKKILMSGGGRCNFTNMDIQAENYLSKNPHFCKSALSRYTQWDFIAMVLDHQIEYHERDHGQLFCDQSSKQIVTMLLEECSGSNIQIKLNCNIKTTYKDNDYFYIQTSTGNYQAQSLVVASGGLSIPKMCASPIGYQLAKKFGHSIVPTKAGLVPFTLHPEHKQHLAQLSGIAVDAIVSIHNQQFRENILFTHRGLSGPAILQISSYWNPGQEVIINLLPDLDLSKKLQNFQKCSDKAQLKTRLADYLPKRLVSTFIDTELAEKPIQQLSQKDINQAESLLRHWIIKPNGTEGYRTAEVTVGGVDCNQVSSKTMQSNLVNGLFFIGEVLDVTGWLGGYNFQWAWSSGWCAGQYC